MANLQEAQVYARKIEAPTYNKRGKNIIISLQSFFALPLWHKPAEWPVISSAVPYDATLSINCQGIFVKKNWKLWIGTSLLFIAGVSTSAVYARDLILSEIQPPGHVLVKSEELMANRLTELTKGELNIQIKHSGQLGNEDASWKNIQNSTLDIARVNFAALINDVPVVKIISLPYLFRSRDHMWRVLNSDFGERVKFDIEKTGAIVLGYYDSGSRSFYTTKKSIRFRADFEGQRIRVQNSPVMKDLITLLGGTPVVIGFDKVVDAFKDGTIDGAENNLTSYVTTEHYKYARYLSLDEHTSVPEVLLMSKKTWESLTSEQQKAVRTAASESSESMKKLWADAETQALVKAKKEGVTVLEKHQIGMNGIETFAMKLYSKYVTNPKDLDTVMNILSSD